MMRRSLMALAMIPAAAAAAQLPAGDAALHAADAGATAALNAAVVRRDDAIAATNRAAQDAYAEELARFHAAQRENDRAQADARAAADAYRASRAAYEADLAAWRNRHMQSPPRTAAVKHEAPPAAPRPACDEAMTGTRLRRCR